MTEQCVRWFDMVATAYIVDDWIMIHIECLAIVSTSSIAHDGHWSRVGMSFGFALYLDVRLSVICMQLRFDKYAWGSHHGSLVRHAVLDRYRVAMPLQVHHAVLDRPCPVHLSLNSC